MASEARADHAENTVLNNALGEPFAEVIFSALAVADRTIGRSSLLTGRLVTREAGC
jgi:hypothetical protein